MLIKLTGGGLPDFGASPSGIGSIRLGGCRLMLSNSWQYVLSLLQECDERNAVLLEHYMYTSVDILLWQLIYSRTMFNSKIFSIQATISNLYIIYKHTDLHWTTLYGRTDLHCTTQNNTDYGGTDLNCTALYDTVHGYLTYTVQHWTTNKYINSHEIHTFCLLISTI